MTKRDTTESHNSHCLLNAHVRGSVQLNATSNIGTEVGSFRGTSIWRVRRDSVCATHGETRRGTRSSISGRKGRLETGVEIRSTRCEGGDGRKWSLCDGRTRLLLDDAIVLVRKSDDARLAGAETAAHLPVIQDQESQTTQIWTPESAWNDARRSVRLRQQLRNFTRPLLQVEK